LAKPKYAKQTRARGLLWGGTTSARQIDTLDGTVCQIDTLDKMARRGRRAPQVGGNFIYFVCFTSYVLLRKTQSSVSLRLTAPFQRSLLRR